MTHRSILAASAAAISLLIIQSPSFAAEGGSSAPALRDPAYGAMAHNTGGEGGSSNGAGHGAGDPGRPGGGGYNGAAARSRSGASASAGAAAGAVAQNTLQNSVQTSATNSVSTNVTASPVSTNTVSPTITASPTATASPTITASPTNTFSPTNTASPTNTFTPTTTVSPTNTVDASSNDSIDASSVHDISNNANNSSTNDNSSSNDNSSNNNNASTNDNSTTVVGGDTNIEAIGLAYDAIDLANLPVGVCQGASQTASGSGNDGLFGIGLGFGRATIDEQCTLRENIRTVATLAEYVPSLRGDLLLAVAHLDGFEHLWPADQHPKCAQWIKNGSKKARKHNCRFPGSPVADAAPLPPQSFTVLFDSDSIALSPRGRDAVADAARAAFTNPGRPVIVEGHTDREGSAAYNERLSQRRAEAVRAELISQGVEAERIAVNYFGETRPVVPTRDGAPEALNRRAEILIRIGARS